jgi:DNA polymerase-3 subunit alpha
LCEGAVKIKELIGRCNQLEMPAVAVTDTNNMFGILEFSSECTSHSVQPIPGTSLDLRVEGVTAPLILLAQNEVGYRNLLKLMTCFYIENKEATKFITLADLARYNDGIIALSGGARGPAGTLFAHSNHDKANELLIDLHALFRDSFYIELSRTGEPNEYETEPFFVEFAIQNNIPLVATNEVFFLDKAMHTAHDALICIAEGTYLTVDDRRMVTEEHYLKTTEEMFELFSDIKEAATNTAIIAQRCSFFPEKKAPVFPRFAATGSTQQEGDCGSSLKPSESELLLGDTEQRSGVYKEVHEHSSTGSTKEETDYEGLSEGDILEEQARIGLQQRLGDSEVPENYAERLKEELALIKSTGFSGYFLVVSDFVKWARDHDIPVGPGRGSGAGSIVAWSLFITDLDPIHYNLFFERFINPERVSLPDFDIDFCQDRRDEVIRYVQNKYGKDRVAHIITFGKLQARAVIRDVGRVMQMPYGQVDKISKLVPQNAVNPVDLKQALEIEPLIRNMMESDDNVAMLINTSLQLEGLYRHASLHAAGIVIGSDAIDTMVPLYSDGETELAITQINMKYIESAGLVKFDFLGLKTLTLIKNACDLIKRYRKIDLDISAINLDDENTFKLMCDVDVIGVFQLESTGMRDVIQKLKPGNLEDIMALISLYRPGPMDNIPTYISRKHGLEKVEYLHPVLEPILKSTYGIMIYQEQVMKVAQEMGGFSLGAADILRRAMGKKIKEEMAKNRVVFLEGAKEKGINSNVADQVFTLMGKFAGYGFNRSHAAAYALISYQTAYLKANFRKEFYVASMNIDILHTEKISKFVQDVRRAGIKILPPDINTSDEYFTIEDNNAIRYALGGLRGSGMYIMRSIVSERREHGKFKDIFDFFRRVQFVKGAIRNIEVLTLAGAFDSIHNNRRQILESLEQLVRFGTESGPKQKLLFDTYQSDCCELRDIPEWDAIEKLDNERSAIGFYLSAHPMDIYSSLLQKRKITSSKDFDRYRGGVITVAGMLISKHEKFAKSGQKYAFITVSDREGTFEVTVFPRLYLDAKEILVAGSPILMEVEVQQDAESTKLVGMSVQNINSITKTQRLYVYLSGSADLDTLCSVLEEIEDGDNNVSFLITNPNGRMTEVDTKYKKNISIYDRERISRIHGVALNGPE